MIFKFYEINKINLIKDKYILFHGKNEGFKNESIKSLLKNKKEILNYEEKELLDNSNHFIESIMTESLFEKEKVLVIKRASDKIFKIIDEATSKNIKDVIIVISADNLDKKSKLRSLFEKKFISVAFYADNEQTLSTLASNFFREKKISISTSNLNLIINKCNGDRGSLINELNKLENYCKTGKKITLESIYKLTNLNENHDVSELVNNCLVKNKKRVIHILNENNFSNEDCILITRTFLSKSKKILILSNKYEVSKNIELTISSSKPPIFWKDKEITKQQIYKWSPRDIKNLIYKVSELELLLKNNVSNSINLVYDFILDQASV